MYYIMSFDLLRIVGWTYGSSSGSVLGSTTSNVVNLGVGDDIVVDGHMLLLGKDSIVGLQVVFLKVLSSLGGSDLDIELLSVKLPYCGDTTDQGVTNGKD
jgi:hypothetical protein